MLALEQFETEREPATKQLGLKITETLNGMLSELKEDRGEKAVCSWLRANIEALVRKEAVKKR